MRIVAALRIEDPAHQKPAFEHVRKAFRENNLIECDDPIEQSDNLEYLIKDMDPNIRSRFQRTVRVVARHAVDDTVASISILNETHINIRIRNPQLNKLLPRGHVLLQEILDEKRQDLLGLRINLADCEVREHGHHDGFIFGSWAGGKENFIEFLYSDTNQKKIFHLCITVVFIFGLFLEAFFTLFEPRGPLSELGLRLGAPMLVSTSVLLLERWAGWLNERSARLHWSPVRSTDGNGPLRNDIFR